MLIPVSGTAATAEDDLRAFDLEREAHGLLRELGDPRADRSANDSRGIFEERRVSGELLAERPGAGAGHEASVVVDQHDRFHPAHAADGGELVVQRGDGIGAAATTPFRRLAKRTRREVSATALIVVGEEALGRGRERALFGHAFLRVAIARNRALHGDARPTIHRTSSHLVERAARVRSRMRGFIDLHSHWVVGVDDGVKTVEESLGLLRALHEAGFDHVVATPHMRPGMFENTRADLEAAYARTRASLGSPSGVPKELGLSAEHYFDDVVFSRLVEGDGIPYPGGKAVLVEFGPRAFPAMITHRFFDLMRKKLRPVLAHPERYEPVWKDPAVLDPIVDGGAVLLLDVAALAGKYGRAPRRAAEALLEEGYYYAACSDAHKASDVADVVRGIRELEDVAGAEETRFLLVEGPRDILDGTVDV